MHRKQNVESMKRRDAEDAEERREEKGKGQKEKRMELHLTLHFGGHAAYTGSRVASTPLMK